MSTDRAGTVRVSPDGAESAVRTDGDLTDYPWLASGFKDQRPDGSRYSNWRSDADVADWGVIHRPPAPPHPVGTVIRRSGKLAHVKKNYWEVATRTPEGWYVVSDTGPWASVEAEQPPDDEDGTWEVLHGPVDGARAS